MIKSVLYYPTINLPDNGWIKKALMYWDKVCTIVPYRGYIGNCGDTVRRLNEYGCYKEVYPDDIFSGDISEFLNVLDCRLSHMLAFGRKEALIHRSKFPEELINRTRDLYPELDYLLRQYNSNDTEWIVVDERVSRIYMKTLAEFAAANDEGLVVGTKNKSDFKGLYHLSGYGGYEVAGVFATLEDCLPMPKASVPLEKILKFKASNKSALLNLSELFARLEAGMEACDGEDDVKDLISDFKKDLAYETKRADESYKEANILTVLGSVSTFVATTAIDMLYEMPVLAAEPEASVAPAIAKYAAQGAVAMVPIVCKWYMEKQRLKKNDFAYIIKAGRRDIVR